MQPEIPDSNLTWMSYLLFAEIDHPFPAMWAHLENPKFKVDSENELGLISNVVDFL